MRLLIILISFSCFCCCASAKTPPKKNKGDPQSFDRKLAENYSKQTYTSTIHVDMSEYEQKLKNRLPSAYIIHMDDKIGVIFKTSQILDGENLIAIKPEAFLGVLSSMVYILLTNRGTYIEVKGYDENWEIAQTRANAVAGYFCLRGVDRTRVSAKGEAEYSKKDFIEVVISKA